MVAALVPGFGHAFEPCQRIGKKRHAKIAERKGDAREIGAVAAEAGGKLGLIGGQNVNGESPRHRKMRMPQ